VQQSVLASVLQRGPQHAHVLDALHALQRQHKTHSRGPVCSARHVKWRTVVNVHIHEVPQAGLQHVPHAAHVALRAPHLKHVLHVLRCVVKVHGRGEIVGTVARRWTVCVYSDVQ